MVPSLAVLICVHARHKLCLRLRYTISIINKRKLISRRENKVEYNVSHITDRKLAEKQKPVSLSTDTVTKIKPTFTAVKIILRGLESSQRRCRSFRPLLLKRRCQQDLLQKQNYVYILVNKQINK